MTNSFSLHIVNMTIFFINDDINKNINKILINLGKFENYG